jgi:hypothetical protein
MGMFYRWGVDLSRKPSDHLQTWQQNIVVMVEHFTKSVGGTLSYSREDLGACSCRPRGRALPLWRTC